MKNLKEELKYGKKGITLIALVITVIVLLILAGVTIASLSGPNGILENAQKAKQETQESQEKELDSLETAETILEEYTNPELKTMKLKVNSGATGEVVLPITNNEENNYTIDWGDGTVAEVKNETKVELGKVASTQQVKIAANDEKVRHTYASQNQEYVVSITGTVKEIDTGYYADYSLLEVEQWGELGIEYISLRHCYNLTKIASPTKNSFINLKEISFQESGLEEIPEDLFSNCANITSFDSAFALTNITEIPEDLFSNCVNVTSFSATFYKTNITKIPENLFKNCDNATFEITFAYCENLQNYINLWEQNYYNSGSNEHVDENMGGAGCYANCTKLLAEGDSDNIPDHWKTYSFPE